MTTQATSTPVYMFPCIEQLVNMRIDKYRSVPASMLTDRLAKNALDSLITRRYPVLVRDLEFGFVHAFDSVRRLKFEVLPILRRPDDDPYYGFFGWMSVPIYPLAPNDNLKPVSPFEPLSISNNPWVGTYVSPFARLDVEADSGLQTFAQQQHFLLSSQDNGRLAVACADVHRFLGWAEPPPRHELLYSNITRDHSNSTPAPVNGMDDEGALEQLNGSSGGETRGSGNVNPESISSLSSGSALPPMLDVSLGELAASSGGEIQESDNVESEMSWADLESGEDVHDILKEFLQTRAEDDSEDCDKGIIRVSFGHDIVDLGDLPDAAELYSELREIGKICDEWLERRNTQQRRSK
ncbi:hypothetical protein MKEN_00036900 [Mycena kentingensis (nom. inval.)]|nr:hypothetical protein MKEN_00036900 [Mycena kentingensis (nom. inval.)]